VSFGQASAIECGPGAGNQKGGFSRIAEHGHATAAFDQLGMIR
jgi:hypothetical protein